MFSDIVIEEGNANCEWTDAEANVVFAATDNLVPLFKATLEKQTGLMVHHEWDGGLIIMSYNNSCVKGCEECGGHKWNGASVLSSLDEKGRLLYDALTALVPLYLDANGKV